MEFFEKPPILGTGAIVRLVIGIVLFALGLGILYGAYGEATRYLECKKNAITLEAECYKITEFDDEGDTDYRVYVRYSYNGQQYSHSYDTYDTKDKAQAMIGQMVSIQINALDPSEFVGEIKIASGLQFALGTGILWMGWFLVTIRIRKYYTQAYGFRMALLEKDLRARLLENCLPTVFCFLLCIGYGVLWYILQEAFSYMWIVSVFFFVIASISLGVWYAQLQKIRNGAYRVSRQTLVEKEIDSSGDSTDYLLHYADSQNKWKRNVSRKRYDAAEIGETIDAVILDGKKKPFFFCERIDTH